MAEIEAGRRHELPMTGSGREVRSGRTCPGARAVPARPRAHPWYCRGQVGEIERICGRFRNPEQLAYGNRDAAHEVLYRVGFASPSLWPDYDGGERDRVEIEIYEHWLEPVPEDAT